MNPANNMQKPDANYDWIKLMVILMVSIFVGILFSLSSPILIFVGLGMFIIFANLFRE